jgi:hypothetical protein
MVGLKRFAIQNAVAKWPVQQNPTASISTVNPSPASRIFRIEVDRCRGRITYRELTLEDHSPFNSALHISRAKYKLEILATRAFQQETFDFVVYIRDLLALWHILATDRQSENTTKHEHQDSPRLRFTAHWPVLLVRGFVESPSAA